MIADEIDGAGPAKAPPLTRGRYHGLLILATVAFAIILVVLGVVINGFIPLKGLAGLSAYVFWAAVLLGKLVVDAYLKWRGVSRSGTTVQTWTGTGAPPAGAEPGTDAVEILTPRTGLKLISIVCLIAALPLFALGCGMLARAFRLAHTDDWPGQVGWWLLLWVGAAYAGSFGLVLLQEARVPKYRYRADAAGFTACTASQSVAWSDVACHRVTTRYDPLGEPAGTWHELLDRHGLPLIKLDLGPLQPADRDRLLRFIQARLPQPIKAEALAEL